jgi:type IV pilus assembly protein PilA
VNRIRERVNRAADDESGFTLIELLVVMLILANLAAIALPSFFNQRSKAQDAKAKELAHTAQVAMETCATNNSAGVYTSCDIAALRAIEPTIPATGVTVLNAGGGYTVTVTAASGNSYAVIRSPTGVMSYPCNVASTKRGDCPGAGEAAGLWG